MGLLLILPGVQVPGFILKVWGPEVRGVHLEGIGLIYPVKNVFNLKGLRKQPKSVWLLRKYYGVRTSQLNIFWVFSAKIQYVSSATIQYSGFRW